jgi:hypothetical protein
MVSPDPSAPWLFPKVGGRQIASHTQRLEGCRDGGRKLIGIDASRIRNRRLCDSRGHVCATINELEFVFYVFRELVTEVESADGDQAFILDGMESRRV